MSQISMSPFFRERTIPLHTDPLIVHRFQKALHAARPGIPRRLRRAASRRHKLDLCSPLRNEERVPILGALVLRQNCSRTRASAVRPSPACVMVIAKVGVRSYTPTKFAGSVWVIGTELRSLFKTTVLPSRNVVEGHACLHLSAAVSRRGQSPVKSQNRLRPSDR
jgi:hypothetical protein